MKVPSIVGVLTVFLGATAFAQTGAVGFLLSQDVDPYVGNEMCVRCHASYEDSFAGSPHDGFEEISDHGCQTCHGPGRAHVRDPRDPSSTPSIERISIEDRRNTCLECHDDTGHDLEHFQAGQACSSCHAIHDYESGVLGAAGDARCVSCHESVDAHAERTNVVAIGGDGWRSRGTPHSAETCASCHTLGNLSVETWDGRAGTERCLSCHAQSHPRFFSSSHARAGLSCRSCHSVHAGDDIDALWPEGYTTGPSYACTECHASVATEFAFNERHRLEEGALECSSCHDPHEPPTRVRLGGFKNQQCTQCHVDKLGPFVFEHGASIAEGCTSCHAPHGSPNRHMLEFQSVADQCYSCHITAPGFHERFTSQTMCTNCHTTIHGSNLHPAFLK
ncbi:MAG: cytochrome c3 family protein [Vicinamibacteria bacterium]